MQPYLNNHTARYADRQAINTLANSPAPVQRIASGQALHVGLLSNPHSGRNRRRFQKISKLLVDYPWVQHREVQTPVDIRAALDDFADKGLDLLAINGGDGTVQATLTMLLHHKPLTPLPLLAILPGGSTNMTAGDVGLPGNHQKALSKLLRWASAKHQPAQILQRPILRVRSASHGQPLYGMFFGAGTIVKGIHFCHQRVYSLGLRHEWASGLATLRVMAAIARRDPAYTAPATIQVSLNQHQPLAQQKFLLLLISTLRRLFFGLRPYWGSGTGALQYTAVQANSAHALLAIPPLLWGRPNRFGTPENGYISQNVNEVQLIMDSPFTLDGEIYPVDSRAGPVVVDQGGPITFIRL